MKTKLTRFFIIILLTACFITAASFDNVLRIQTTFSSAVELPEEVYLGGKPLGVEIGTEGVIVAGTIGVVTANGMAYPSKNADIKSGDIIISVAGKTVKRPLDISDALKNVPNGKVVVKYKRDNETKEVIIDTAIDVLSGERRLGVNVKDDITGIGTLTFVTKNDCFAALGHHIADYDTGLSQQLNQGNIFNCEVTGAKKAADNHAGELIGNFNRFDDGIGVIYKNNDFGIYGQYFGDLSGFNPIFTADESEIKHGKAYIYTCIEGDKPKFYTIEIIKTYPQETAATKSMVISVTDKRLIEKTGGIVQGMSGSPVVQDGKLIGAVTHVFVGDATKGYAVYIDWMLQNAS